MQAIYPYGFDNGNIRRFSLYVLLSVLAHALGLTLLVYYTPQPAQKEADSYSVIIVDSSALGLKPATAPVARPAPAMPPKAALPRPVAAKPLQPGIEAIKEPADTTESPPALPQLPGLDSLLDSSVIRQQARADTIAASSDKDTGITFDTRQMMYRGYMDLLRQKIEGAWQYPHKAIKNRIHGDLVVRFVILKDGSLGELKVLRTSGYRVLDNAALKALRDAEPYWPLPEGWGKQSLTIPGHFIYTHSGYYVR